MEVEGKQLAGSPGVFLYNPALLPRKDLQELFLVRHAELARILNRLAAERTPGNHLLIIGERGMGKTTLLIRIAHAVDEDPSLKRRWLPVRFDEEQYNIGELADVWLNCLETIGQATGETEPSLIAQGLLRNYHGQELEEAALLRLKEYSLQKDRSLLLLVDNLDILLDSIDPDVEAHRLREVLLHEPWLTLVGAATDPILASFDYESPFYELFEVIELQPLSSKESIELLRGLGGFFEGDGGFSQLLIERRDVLETLHLLIRGNLRTTTILFTVLRDHREAKLGTLLDHLFDQHTSRYKELIESLPRQGQRVFDALARAWNPTTAEQIADDLRIQRGAASAQLHRLVDRNLARKVQVPQQSRRSISFCLRDRFLNLWYLMRGGRSQRRLLDSLVEFIELFYGQCRSSPTSSDALGNRLQRMGLISGETIDAARRMTDGGSEEQLGLFEGNAEASPEVRLLALSCSGNDKELEVAARQLLHFDKNAALARLILADLLERRDETREALSVIEEELAERRDPWIELERARLRAGLGDDVDAIEDDLHPIARFEQLPAAELASAIVELARKTDGAFQSMLQRLLRRAKKNAAEDMTVLLADCELEHLLGHRVQALQSFEKAAVLARRDSSPGARGAVLEAALELSASDLGKKAHSGNLASEVLKILKESGLAEEWLPLCHALALLGGEGDRLEGLAPEMRSLTEVVIERIREIGSTGTSLEQR